MQKVVGIRFKPSGKIYDFSCGPFVLDVGDKVIVTTEQGLGYGLVATAPVPLSERTSKSPLKKVFRLATDADSEQREKNIQLENEAVEYCQKQVDELKLDMNLFSVESTFDTSKLTFFFTAEGRVDFRQLVKNLVKQFRVRIEMRQVGIRNQAKMCGGLGRCGREICCSSYIEKFDPVSIRMAKEQGLSLNPTKISGLCGRLMCCLTFENETYKSIKKDFPKIGKTVVTPKGKGKVIRHNVICSRITVKLEDNTECELKVSEVQTFSEDPPRERTKMAGDPEPKPETNDPD
ncbi:MAG: stage 0 sporulation family protein [Proteobacteria bacterium]|nr:stage 0 sporulation family protein [Pseudomonadota bacterium]